MKRQRSSNDKGTVRALLVALVVATAGFLVPSPGLAATEVYKIDPEHTAITFSIKHFFSKVPGSFTEFEGTIALDPADFSMSSRGNCH